MIADYKSRMVAEHEALCGKLGRLINFLEKWDNDSLDFMPACPRWLLEEQRATMVRYMEILEIRMKLEGVEFTERNCASC